MGIDYSPQYLERFFRNLLLGEQWDLRSRYLYINPPAEWQNQPNLSTTPTSTEQAPEQVPEQVVIKAIDNQLDINLYSELQKQLITAIGYDKRSIKELLDILQLRHRPNFIEYHLRPAVEARLVTPLYPNNLNHPRQKYLLTVKGMMLFNQLEKK